MRAFVLTVAVLLVVDAAFGIQLRLRRRRSTDKNDFNTSEVEVISDNSTDQVHNSGDKEVVDATFDDNGLNLAVHFPKFVFDEDAFNQHFRNAMNAFRKAMDDMKRRFEEANATMSQYPENHNETKTETVTIGGKEYIRKETVITKNVNGNKLLIKSVTLVPKESESEEDKSGESGNGQGEGSEKESKEEEKEKEKSKEESKEGQESSKEEKEKKKDASGETEGKEKNDQVEREGV